MTVILLGMTARVQANTCDTYKFSLPESSKTVGGRTFGLEETKELLVLVECAKYLQNFKRLAAGAIDLEKDKVRSLERQSDLYSRKYLLMAEESLEANKMWKRENSLRHIAEDKKDHSWTGWAVAAGFAATTLLLVVVR